MRAWCTREWVLGNGVHFEVPAYQMLFWTLFVVWIILYFAGVFTLTTLNFSRSSDGFPMSSRKLSCYKTYWETYSRINDECGVGGGKCLPFSSDWVVTRCPRNCIGDGLDYPVIGDKYYTASSLVCASAVHAGVIEDAAGGCFKMRFAGEQTFFNGTKKNGVTSHVLGWFPKSMEFAKVENGNACNDISPWVDVFISLGISVLFLVVRVRSSLAVSCLVVTGFLYLVSEDLFTEDAYISRLNAYSPRLFTLFLFCGFTWPIAGRITFPDPRRFPLDGLLFYFLPFWLGIHMDFLQTIGIDLTFSQGMFSSTSMIIGFVLFIIIGGAAVLYQFLQLYRARKLSKVLICVVFAIIPILIVSLGFSDLLSFHFHHYMVGMVGFLIFIGQPKSRISIIFQALMLGVLVNGVTIWNIAPLYDPAVTPSSVYPLFWTGVNTTGTTVSLEFATLETVMNVWNCSGNISSSSPSVSVQTSSTDSLLPTQNPSFTVSTSGVVWYEGFIAPNADGSYSYVVQGLKPGLRFQFAVGNQTVSQTISSSRYLYANTSRALIGGGYYNGTDVKFSSSPCNRFAALNPNVTLPKT
uniref:LCCL domain-containing protein n=1 Tax=Mucochytrium quahogii TaxID=96639 RepID=A0A7S2RY58_9STRA|mmetsp:Transcript_45289/g.72680  ORF Transcript_45289/g.72680 Transcript_45289/m.72680 type:complete len:580 (-) Transcript_45289:2906-4645(-)